MFLGKDTDINGVITGALASILYGFKSIPLL
ncbi:ADP-ribosylglycohydrolase family protein [Myroides injenensis]|nr:ADP-ribosylglycohydrolase family protein [Myroides injenensis]